MIDPLDIPPMLDRRPIVWSYTMLNTYRSICAHQAAERFIYKRVPFVETPAMKRGNEVHSAMEYRVGGGKQLPVSMQQYETFAAVFDGKGAKVEQWLGVTREGKSCDTRSSAVFGRGKLDLHIVNGETGYLADHKTGKVREDPFELEVQAVLLHARYPQLRKIVGQYLWLGELRIGQLHDLSSTDRTWEEINRIVQSIEADRKTGIWEKRQGPLCKWCACFDCEFNQNPEQQK